MSDIWRHIRMTLTLLTIRLMSKVLSEELSLHHSIQPWKCATIGCWSGWQNQSKCMWWWEHQASLVPQTDGAWMSSLTSVLCQQQQPTKDFRFFFSQFLYPSNSLLMSSSFWPRVLISSLNESNSNPRKVRSSFGLSSLFQATGSLSSSNVSRSMHNTWLPLHSFAAATTKISWTPSLVASLSILLHLWLP